MKTKKINRKQKLPFQYAYTGHHQDDYFELQWFLYNEMYFEEQVINEVDKLNFEPANDKVAWFNVFGLSKINEIVAFCESQKIHSLLIADILDVNQRPKSADVEGIWFLAVNSVNVANNEIEKEHISLLFDDKKLILFQETKRGHFEHIRERLRNKLGRARKSDAYYLLFLLLESIVDNYFTAISEIENFMLGIEKELRSSNLSPQTLEKIEVYKSIVFELKSEILPLKDFILKLERGDMNYGQTSNLKYFLEVKDLCLSVIDNCDILNTKIESRINLFFSIQNHRLNEVMKTLTIVGSIFLPLTFIAGIYGMNFDYMPELSWIGGYPTVLLLMIAITTGMFVYFKKRKWF